jgi:hypothetical protein
MSDYYALNDAAILKKNLFFYLKKYIRPLIKTNQHIVTADLI